MLSSFGVESFMPHQIVDEMLSNVAGRPLTPAETGTSSDCMGDTQWRAKLFLGKIFSHDDDLRDTAIYNFLTTTFITVVYSHHSGPIYTTQVRLLGELLKALHGKNFQVQVPQGNQSIDDLVKWFKKVDVKP